MPFESVFGDGSAIGSSIGVVLAGAALALRRLRPAASILVFVVWLALGIATLGDVHALFFGQVVPFAIALYSLARHGQGRVPWIGAAVAAAVLLFGDIFIEALQGIDELIFHWSVCTLAFAVGWGLRVSEERAVGAALRLSAVEYKSQVETAAAVAAERTRIARELHDILAHSVSVIVVQAGAAEQAVDDDPAFVRRALRTIRETGTASTEEMQRVVTLLRDPDNQAMLDPQPGIEGLAGLVEAAEQPGLRIDLDTQGELDDLPAGLGLAVYRIVQESLTNVRKHSDATQVSVAVRANPDGVEIDVTDNGSRTRPSDGGQGHGLIGMQERVTLYGGKLTARRTGEGFRVSALLPLAAVHHA